MKKFKILGTKTGKCYFCKEIKKVAILANFPLVCKECNRIVVEMLITCEGKNK